MIRLPNVALSAMSTTPHRLAPTFGACLVCFKKNAPEATLLCEMCGGAFHMYCLTPKVPTVPDEEWFCDSCLKDIYESEEAEEEVQQKEVIDDGLDQQVAALPPSITSRFGEICWGNGGTGYGWWPSIIYDPRWTRGAVRSDARKHLGSRHLVYFYQCTETPFSILSNKDIKGWIEGLAHDYHLGRAAKTSGRHRYRSFQEALYQACIKMDQPAYERLDWDPGVETSSPVETKGKERAQPRNRNPEPRKRQRRDVEQRPVRPVDEADSVSADSEMVCTILAKAPSQEDKTIGFVLLPSQQKSTFADVRQKIFEDLVDDLLPFRQWRFFLPVAGVPVSKKQEIGLGALRQFLRKASDQVGKGTFKDPIKVYIIEG